MTKENHTEDAIILTFDETMMEKIQQDYIPAYYALCEEIINWMGSERDDAANKSLQNVWFNYLETMEIAKADYDNGFLFLTPQFFERFREVSFIPSHFYGALEKVMECCEVEGMPEDEIDGYFSELGSQMLSVAGGKILVRRKGI